MLYGCFFMQASVISLACLATSLSYLPPNPFILATHLIKFYSDLSQNSLSCLSSSTVKNFLPSPFSILIEFLQILTASLQFFFMNSSLALSLFSSYIRNLLSQMLSFLYMNLSKVSSQWQPGYPPQVVLYLSQMCMLNQDFSETFMAVIAWASLFYSGSSGLATSGSPWDLFSARSISLPVQSYFLKEQYMVIGTLMSPIVWPLPSQRRYLTMDSLTVSGLMSRRKLRSLCLRILQSYERQLRFYIEMGRWEYYSIDRQLL